jgi:gas vesicle protein
MMRNRKQWPQLASAFAIGLGAGAALGLLFAPQSGEDTRSYLRDAAQGAAAEAVSQGKSAVRTARKSLDSAKEFVNEVADSAEEARRAARNSAS